jgi:hypothetical protein
MRRQPAAGKNGLLAHQLGGTGTMFRTALIAFALMAAAAHAEASDFIGNWRNPDPKPGGITRVAISPNGGNRVDVRAYGDCHPGECDWGLVQGSAYYANPKSDHVTVIVATFHFGFAHHQITFRKGAGGQLSFEMLTKLDDNSERHDYGVVGTLKPTNWVGPIAQVWQAQAALQTGWGGGVRGLPAPLPAENCTAVDTRGARAVADKGSWTVKAGGKVLIATGGDDKAALLAEAAFRYYRFDRRCTAGGPWKPYWRSASGFGTDRMGGIYCLAINPTTAHLVPSKNSWNIVDGPTTLVELGPFKPQAEAMLGLIRSRKLTGECFIGSPDIMTFWVSEPLR